MSYDPEKDMPRTAEQLDICVDHYFTQGIVKYEAEIAKAETQAEAAYAKLPDSDDKPTLADFISQAVSMVPPAQTREEWKQHFLAAGYGPQEMPESMPDLTFTELKAKKKAELGAAFYTACQHPTVTTAGGWEADANETANRNVQGLVTTLEAKMMEGATIADNGEVIVENDLPTAQFCDADNNFHEVNLEEIRAIQLLIIAKGQALYARKWELRSAIEAAQDEAALNAITISFTA